MNRQAGSHTRVFSTVLALLVLAGGVLSAIPGRIGRASAESEQAQEIGEPVEVEEETTEERIVYANPDGTYTAEIASGPVRVGDPESPSGWSDIDVSLEVGPGGLKPRVAEADIVFSGGGSGELASITENGLSFGIGSDANLPVPVVSGDTATYPEVAPGIDLTLQARPAGFDQSYVIEAPPTGPLTFDLPLSLVGLTAALDEDGELLLSDAGGNLVAHASPAVMFGAEIEPHSGEPVHTALVATSIVQGPGGPVLRVSPDPAFFSTPGLGYPVVVDPAPDFSVDADTYVRSSAPTTSYGSDQQLKAGVNGTDVHRSLLSFSGTEVLDDNRIISANLKLWETHSYSCTASALQVYEATAPFTSLATWNTAPATGTMYASASVAHGFSSSCPNAQVSLSTGGTGGLSLADLVQEWAWGITEPDGFVLRAGSESDANGWKRFSSSDAASNAPVLTVSFDVTVPDASDSEDGYTGWSQDVLSSPEDYITDQMGGGCSVDRWGNGADGSYTYKIFDEYGSSDADIELNASEFDPERMDEFPEEKYPVLILVHGGGWVAGCRSVVAKEAKLFTGDSHLQRKDLNDDWVFVAQQFIVLSVDYRLACHWGSYPEIPLSPLPEFCGWRWDTPDPEVGGQEQVAVHDIEDVIRWVKATDGWQDKTGSDYDRWNGEDIFVLGASAGGNLVASAAANSAADAEIRPTAAAILSGFPETGQTSEGPWSCDSGSSNQTECWEHLNNYLNCGVNSFGQASDEVVTLCQGSNGRYEVASPLNGPWFYDDTPAMFIANAGYGGGNNYDLSPKQLAEDFHDQLDTVGGYEPGTNLDLCEVASGGHATGYLDKWDPSHRSCYGESVEVIETLVDFFGDQTGEW